MARALDREKLLQAFDEIGRAVGVQYEDNEELKGEAKIAERDRNRWELDPASAEDYPDHDQD